MGADVSADLQSRGSIALRKSNRATDAHERYRMPTSYIYGDGAYRMKNEMTDVPA